MLERLMAPASDCKILVPVHNGIEPDTQDCLAEAMNAGYLVQTIRGGSQIDLARSMLASAALEGGYPETLWIDADQTFTVKDIETLRSHNLPFTAGLYVRKDGRSFAAQFKAPENLIFGLGGGLIEMQGVGFGFTHIRREVFEAIAKTLPLCSGTYDGTSIYPFFMPVIEQKEDGTTIYLSEDYAFTNRARAAGFPPFADTTLKIGHIGKKVWTWDDLNGQTKIEILKMRMSEPPIKGFVFPEDVRGWLSKEEGVGLATFAKGRDVLEIGSYCGRSTICIAQTAKSLCCVDPFDGRDTPEPGDTYTEFGDNLERYGVKAKVLRGLFGEVEVEVKEKFDLIFIDGGHEELQVINDARRAIPLLRPGGFLAFHDYRPVPEHYDSGWHPGVTVTVNRLIAAGATLVNTIGTIAVIQPSSITKESAMMTDQEQQQVQQLYAKIGRLQMDLETKTQEAAQNFAAMRFLCQAVQRVKDGSLPLEALTVELTDINCSFKVNEPKEIKLAPTTEETAAITTAA